MFFNSVIAHCANSFLKNATEVIFKKQELLEDNKSIR